MYAKKLFGAALICLASKSFAFPITLESYDAIEDSSLRMKYTVDFSTYPAETLKRSDNNGFWVEYLNDNGDTMHKKEYYSVGGMVGDIGGIYSSYFSVGGLLDWAKTFDTTVVKVTHDFRRAAIWNPDDCTVLELRTSGVCSGSIRLGLEEIIGDPGYVRIAPVPESKTLLIFFLSLSLVFSRKILRKNQLSHHIINKKF